MALYSTNNLSAASPTQTNMASTAKTFTSVTAATATLRRGYIYEFEVGTDGAPNATDCAVVWDLALQTSLGTGVAATAPALDSVDAATGMVATINYTIEPIIASGVSSRWVLAANQRASYRWVVNPGGPGEIVIPATNVSGYALRGKSATYASTAIATVFYRE